MLVAALLLLTVNWKSCPDSGHKYKCKPFFELFFPIIFTGDKTNISPDSRKSVFYWIFVTISEGYLWPVNICLSMRSLSSERRKKEGQLVERPWREYIHITARCLTCHPPLPEPTRQGNELCIFPHCGAECPS